MRQLPDDTHLAYVVSHEAWYGTRDIVRRPQINVAASAHGSGGGVRWEFTVEEVDLGSHGKPIRLKIFDDAFAAFAEIPEFFASLNEDGAGALDDVRHLLDSLGAVDETERKSPIATPRERRNRRITEAVTAAAIASYGAEDGTVLEVYADAVAPAVIKALDAEDA
jgi:hypothetical protein